MFLSLIAFEFLNVHHDSPSYTPTLKTKRFPRYYPLFRRNDKKEKAATEGPDEKELKKKEKQRLEKEKKEQKERLEREKKEQKEREKKESEMKKKFKVSNFLGGGATKG